MCLHEQYHVNDIYLRLSTQYIAKKMYKANREYYTGTSLLA